MYECVFQKGHGDLHPWLKTPTWRSTQPSSPRFSAALSLAGMTTRSEVVHPLSLNFANERKVVMLREVKKMSFENIRKQVRNLKGQRPSKELMRRTVKLFSKRTGKRTFKYDKCGRQAWKVDDDVKKFLVARLLALRTKCICTATTLQRELAKKKRVKLACSTIRKVLFKAGYQWRRRAQKPKLDKERMRERCAFAQKVVDMSAAELARWCNLSIDGVVLSCPPKDAVDRANFCSIGDTHMYRKRGEAASPKLAAHDVYGKQVPDSRAVPLWGGISPGGFMVIAFHPTKKIDPEDWVGAVEGGALTIAVKEGKPVLKKGPWGVLCDNEGFLHAAESKAAHRKQKIILRHVPARSPDLNVIEKFWSWLRRELRKRDLNDLVKKRPPLGKMAYRQRILAVCRLPKAKAVAANYFKSFRKVCQEVVLKKGAMARN